ncbi:MAG: DUF1462 family protein [Coriobacteriia bacterium]|nr:DUF1462 family protein [Coriobacteriia bacterium]
MTAIIRTELERRYGDEARVLYHNVQLADERAEHSEVVAQIEQRGLMYPVTSVDGVLVYDGAVSYPAIMRAVQNKVAERAELAQA